MLRGIVKVFAILTCPKCKHVFDTNSPETAACPKCEFNKYW